MAEQADQLDETAVNALCEAAESYGDAYTAAVCLRALHGIVPVDLIRRLTVDQWRIIEHMSQRSAEKIVIGWTRPASSDEDARATIQIRAVTAPTISGSFAKGTPHK